MANNTHRYGFRYAGNLEGGTNPRPLRFPVASAYHAQVSATDVDLNIGDVCTINAGFAELGAGAGSGNLLYGVFVGFFGKVDSNAKARPVNRLPAGTTYASEANRSWAWVIPFGTNVWEIDVSGNTSAFDTYVEYLGGVNKNVDLAHTLDITNADRPKANPTVTLTGIGTATKDFRIVGVSGTAENQDFSGNFVKLRVVINETNNPPYTVVGS